MNLHITENKINNKIPITPVSFNNPRTGHPYKKSQTHLPDTSPYSQKSDTWSDCMEQKCIREKGKKKKAAAKMGLVAPGSRQIKSFSFSWGIEILIFWLSIYRAVEVQVHAYSWTSKDNNRPWARSLKARYTLGENTPFFSEGTPSLFYCWTIPNLKPSENRVAHNNGLRSRP